MTTSTCWPGVGAPDLESVVREHGGKMLAVARRFLSNEHDAQDAVQDAFLSAFKASSSFQGNCQLTTWLHRIVVNSCLMKLRSQQRQPTQSCEDLLPAFDETGHHTRAVRRCVDRPLEQIVTDELRTHVRACINRLPDIYRTVLLLRDIEEFDTEETARMLGVSEAVVKTRLHRGRLALRTLLEPVVAGDLWDSATLLTFGSPKSWSPAPCLAGTQGWPLPDCPYSTTAPLSPAVTCRASRHPICRAFGQRDT